jgi:multimeric flavodoxin WrbA
MLSTPVYYGAATAQMASLISRFYGTKGKPLDNTIGDPIVVALRAGAGHNFISVQLMFFFMIKRDDCA